MENKLFTLLAKTDALANRFKQGLKDYIGFFKNNQGQFLGVHKTYIPQPDTIDDPKRRGTLLIVTTVDEKLKWFVESNRDYIDALFSQEATNASGDASTNLYVDGVDWGIFSSLELLRLKSFLENGDFKKVYETIPVRSDGIIWEPTTSEVYTDRAGIFQTEIIKHVNKTTSKEDYILHDSNLEKLPGKNYTPIVAQRTTVEILGNSTEQTYTGSWSQRQKAETLRRLDTLHVAVIEALKRANDCEISESSLTADQLFNYLHGKETT